MNYNRLFKKEVSLILITIIAVILLIIGTTYALFQNVGSSDTNIVKTGTLSVSVSGEYVITDDLLPIETYYALKETPYYFNVNNTGTLDAKYSLIIENIANDPVPNEYIFYQIDNGNAYNLNETGATTIKTGELIVRGTSKKHSIRVWLSDEAPTSIINKNITMQISVSSEPTTFSGVDILIAKANTEAITEYDAGNKSEMYTFKHSITSQVNNIKALTDYRYIGGGTYCIYSDGENNDLHYNTDANGNCPTLYNYIDDYTDPENSINYYYMSECPTKPDNSTVDCTTLTEVEKVVLPSVNNYIKFNCNERTKQCETWRIVGVYADSNGTKNIKIVREQNLSDYIFDAKENGVGSSVADTGSNDWTDSQTMYALNNKFIYETGILKTNYTITNNIIRDSRTDNNIVYELGYKPSAISPLATEYSHEKELTWNIEEQYKNLIARNRYFIANVTSLNSTASSMYSNERATSTYYVSGLPFSRSYYWEGYVGLLYASDYYYTYELGVDNGCAKPDYYTKNCYNSAESSSWLYSSNQSLMFMNQSTVKY